MLGKYTPHLGESLRRLANLYAANLSTDSNVSGSTRGVTVVHSQHQETKATLCPMPPSLSPETLAGDRGENLGEGEKEAAPVTQPLWPGLL